jgi:hypothetical protein
MRGVKNLFATLTIVVMLSACASNSATPEATKLTDEQIAAVCESRPPETLASQTDRRWYAETCSVLD